MGSEETEHDATGALITLVAGHMLNVHPVMHAATATVGGSDPQEGQEKGRGTGAGCRRYVLPTATCFSVQRGRGADHLLSTWIPLPLRFHPFFPSLSFLFFFFFSFSSRNCETSRKRYKPARDDL